MVLPVIRCFVRDVRRLVDRPPQHTQYPSGVADFGEAQDTGSYIGPPRWRVWAPKLNMRSVGTVESIE